ncbi:two-component system chemotaxis response regulator CheY [Rhodopseudomonas thermotolerans]|jgi:two-component system chemotaxis response regulator CheY|uniref:Two-component system chemotaxis response regulator CheY n=2 Tax=Rhodopseudomonas TaxID=1073 RepID=A0A336JVG0_9BRAD|nr:MULTISPECIES: response regulator [Rhodopseudomonas]RED21880.1 two-component system chemotaxis response regulator CheY [Rhodopseudomonas pentothenatexigens]REF88646.1 two-component system chemotaxis response regulator CheY [Rhodopseudomonas thermotolerans]SSW93570.1 two-component system chemotaxis response regulator CheY [Rhodopseudomonas pentothenatexigens]
MHSEERTDLAQAETNADRVLGLLDLLVVDDDLVQRMLIGGAAEKAGYAVTHAATCAEGIALVRVKHFDCITLDLKLDDGDGADVMRAMAAAKYQGPMIVISGMSSQHRRASRDLAKSLGMELLQSFPKPIDLAALRISLANLRSTVAGLPIVHSWGEVCGPRFERNG